MDLDISIYRFLCFFLVLPKFVLNDPVCSPPYDCVTASRCADRISMKDREKVHFRCEDKSKICCPPATVINKDSVHLYLVETIDFGNIRPKQNVSDNTEPEKSTAPVGANCSSSNYANGGGVSLQPPRMKPTEFPNSKFASHRNFNLLPPICGLTQSPNRITEGEEADLAEYPWMALVGEKDERGNPTWVCGGTLINSRYILTAAHCAPRKKGSLPIVRLGEHNLENKTDCDNINNFCVDPAIDVNVEEIILHSQWNISTIKNDIALYRLSEEAPETFSISSICLPIDMTSINESEGIKYKVAGWGKADWSSKPSSSVLRKGTLSSVTNNECNICNSKVKEVFCPLSKTQMCAQGWKFVDVCKGDSGGPLMLTLDKVYQVGITSFKASDYCGAENIPSIFTRVESYMEWILDNIRN